MRHGLINAWALPKNPTFDTDRLSDVPNGQAECVQADRGLTDDRPGEPVAFGPVHRGGSSPVPGQGADVLSHGRR